MCFDQFFSYTWEECIDTENKSKKASEKSGKIQRKGHKLLVAKFPRSQITVF